VSACWFVNYTTLRSVWPEWQFSLSCISRANCRSDPAGVASRAPAAEASAAGALLRAFVAGASAAAVRWIGNSSISNVELWPTPRENWQLLIGVAGNPRPLLVLLDNNILRTVLLGSSASPTLLAHGFRQVRNPSTSSRLCSVSRGNAATRPYWSMLVGAKITFPLSLMLS